MSPLRLFDESDLVRDGLAQAQMNEAIIRAIDARLQERLGVIGQTLDEILARLPKQRTPKRKGRQALWAGAVHQLWSDANNGGALPMGTVNLLWPVVDEVGEGQMLDRLRVYLAATEPQFYSLRRFAATHGQFAPKEPTKPFDFDAYERKQRGETDG